MKRVLIFVLLFSLPLAAGKKKSLGTMYRKADQRVELANAAETLGAAHRKCENYAWAAIVEAMMRQQQVPITQETWAERTSGGMKCYSTLDDYSSRAQALNGDYTLDSGRKVRIHADFIAGSASPDALIYSLQNGRPLLVVWNGRPYMLYGLVYDEMVHSSGKAHAFIIRELHLLDAALPADSPKRAGILKKEKDDDTEIAGLSGVMSVSVDARNFYDIPATTGR
jgi:hypothetical protein